MNTVPAIGQEIDPIQLRDALSSNSGSLANVPAIGQEIPTQMIKTAHKPTAWENIKSMANKTADWLPTVGAVAGGAIPALLAPETGGISLGAESLGVGLGTAAGELGKDIVHRMTGEKAPTETQSIVGAANAGIISGGLNIVGGKALSALAKSNKNIFSQVVKAFTGIDEKTATRILQDPEILNRALPMEQVEKQFGEFVDKSGFKYGPEAIKAVNGGKRISSNAIEQLTNDTLNKIEAVSGGLEKMPENKAFVKGLTQEALAARYSLQDLIKSAQVSGKKSLARSFIGDKSMVDDWLENQLPGFKAVNEAYSESLAKKAFEPMLATNKNGTVSVLRTLAGTGAILHNPLTGVPMLAASSPYMWGKALQAATKIPPQTAINAISGVSANAIENLKE